MIKRVYTVTWVLRGYLRPEGDGRENNPTWDFVLGKLEKLHHGDGTVKLELFLKNSDSKELRVHAANDFYSIIFNDINAEGDILRTSFNNDAEEGIHVMHGMHWPTETIFTNYDAVYDIFKQFFETGEVSSSPILPGGPQIYHCLGNADLPQTRRGSWTGHLWQGRFGSVAMDEDHLAHAVRYVSLNPVRARLVAPDSRNHGYKNNRTKEEQILDSPG